MKFSRREALTTGLATAGGFIGTMIAGCNSPGTGSSNTLPASGGGATMAGMGLANAPNHSRERDIPPGITSQIESIIQAQGTSSNGVFDITIDRNDITDVTLHGVPILPSFQINGDMFFQSIGGGRVMMNGDLCLKVNEVLPFIQKLIAGNIIFQAEHQHFYDFVPIVFFVHFRAAGDPIHIARAMKAALDVTSTPFPQTLPSNPTTPLPAMQIGQIIGANPTINSDGVVSLAAVADFGMTAAEVQPLVRHMLSLGWDSGCLYNQETDEMPQLYFDHMFKTGNPLELAREIRSGLNMNSSACSAPSEVRLIRR